jgi:hypothetical protein
LEFHQLTASLLEFQLCQKCGEFLLVLLKHLNCLCLCKSSSATPSPCALQCQCRPKLYCACTRILSDEVVHQLFGQALLGSLLQFLSIRFILLHNVLLTHNGIVYTNIVLLESEC